MARMLPLSVVFSLAVSPAVFSQIIDARQLGFDPSIPPIPPIMASMGCISGFGGAPAMNGVPGIEQMARQSYSQTSSRGASCESHRLQEQWAQRQRSASGSRLAPTAAPDKRWTDEERAASKFRAAHSLWQLGNDDAARRWLEGVLKDYSYTPTAERARLVLARL